MTFSMRKAIYKTDFTCTCETHTKWRMDVGNVNSGQNIEYSER